MFATLARPPRPLSRGKRLAFRLLAVLIGLTPLVAAEALCRVAGWGQLTEIDDPYLGFTAVRPLFVPDASGQRLEIAKTRQAYFRPESFAARKGPREFRIFCLGGSTVQGRPYAIETSFTTWLELSLRAADPSRDWEVVNCGGVSYASYRLAPIMRELLAYQPDLFIVYTGHNEFLEDRTYGQVKRTPAVVARLHAWCSYARVYNACRAAWRGSAKDHSSAAPERAWLPAEVDALLDYRGGLDDYHRDDAWRQDVVEHFEFNLRRMVLMAHQAGVPLVLVNPTSNLKDCPPLKFAGGDDLDDPQRAEFAALWEQARDSRDAVERIGLLERAVAIDDRHAGAYFLLGQSYHAAGRLAEARAALLRAKDEDLCPLRMIEPLHAALARVARSTRTPLVDARAQLDALRPADIPGDELHLDHIHPSIDGHQRIAAGLLDELIRLDLVRPRAGWQARQQQLYVQQLATLDAIYYARGRQRLEGLRRWTQGRAEKTRTGKLDH